MKKILLLLVLAMNCENVAGSFSTPVVWRCENDEAICYIDSRTGISCKFKDVIK